MTDDPQRRDPDARDQPDFPKPLVRLRAVPGGYDAEVRMAADGEAVSAAEAEGFAEVPLPADAGRQEFPKWVYHEDGRRQVVSNVEEEEKAEGFRDTPPEPEEEDVYGGAVPPAVGDAVTRPTSTRGPVPVDRG